MTTTKKPELEDLPYGFMNRPANPTARDTFSLRRGLDPAHQTRVLQSHFSAPDADDKRRRFPAIVIQRRRVTHPRSQDRLGVLEYAAEAQEETNPLNRNNYVYKVLLLPPSREPRPKPRALNDPVIDTYQDVFLSPAAADANGKSPSQITPGTFVRIAYEDLRNLTNPTIEEVGQLLNVESHGVSLTQMFEGEVSWDMALGEGSQDTDQPPAGDPKIYRKHGITQRQLTATWVKGTVRTTIRNGDIKEDAPDLLQSATFNGRTTTLLPPALADLKKLAAAYEAAFAGASKEKDKWGGQGAAPSQPDKFLAGGGYRTYASQEYLYGCYKSRTRETYTVEAGKNKGKEATRTVCQNGCGSCNFAAKPGTSGHGWGSAVDIGSRAMFKRQTSSAQFKWLNKYAEKYNWMFNVEGEPWHLQWTKLKVDWPSPYIGQRLEDLTVQELTRYTKSGLTNPVNESNPLEVERA